MDVHFGIANRIAESVLDHFCQHIPHHATTGRGKYPSFVKGTAASQTIAHGAQTRALWKLRKLNQSLREYVIKTERLESTGATCIEDSRQWHIF
eukprot:2287092-Pyramimonas_sp.AAC.1